MIRKIWLTLVVLTLVLVAAAFVQFFIGVWVGSTPAGTSGVVTLILAVLVGATAGFLYDEIEDD